MRLQSFSAMLVLSSVSVCALADPTEYATVTAEPGVRARTVRFADLNLQRHEGVETLYQRIRSAADLVCYEGDTRPLQTQRNVRKCTSDAIDRAVTKVGVPALAAFHEQNGNASPMTMVARESR